MALASAAVLSVVAASAQQRLTLDDCREMAVSSSRELKEEQTRLKMAGYDRKIALANYFPTINVTGTYMWNNKELTLISKESSNNLRASVEKIKQTQEEYKSSANALLQEIRQTVATNPEMAAEYANSSLWQYTFSLLEDAVAKGQAYDIATPIGLMASSLEEDLTLDIRHIFGLVISVRQPLFVGGKIIYSNQAARLAEQLAESSYEMKYVEILTDIDQAYWQIVTIAAKKRLAESYVELLEQMETDVEKSVAAGLSTKSDELQVKVKAGDARLLLTKAGNGLKLSKMLLCKKIGLPLDSDIVLADEELDEIPVAVPGPGKDMEQIYEDRPETKSLDLAAKIYKKKADIVRADMFPQIALTANYLASSPSFKDGFQNKFSGRFSAGVVVSVPLFHGTEALHKTKKAKAEASLYQDKLEDAREMITLEVTQNRLFCEEALERLELTRSSLESAEENMRSATAGFEAGVVNTNTVLMAQTAWLQAHSEYIDAGVGLQVAVSNLEKSEGNLHSGEPVK